MDQWLTRLWNKIQPHPIWKQEPNLYYVFTAPLRRIFELKDTVSILDAVAALQMKVKSKNTRVLRFNPFTVECFWPGRTPSIGLVSGISGKEHSDSVDYDIVRNVMCRKENARVRNHLSSRYFLFAVHAFGTTTPLFQHHNLTPWNSHPLPWMRNSQNANPSSVRIRIRLGRTIAIAPVRSWSPRAVSHPKVTARMKGSLSACTLHRNDALRNHDGR